MYNISSQISSAPRLSELANRRKFVMLERFLSFVFSAAKSSISIEKS